MDKKYVYFVSFRFINGYGNTSVISDGAILGMDDIRKLEKMICE